MISWRPLARAALVAAVLTAGAAPLGAACRGRDLFSDRETEAPAVDAALMQEISSVPFGRGRLFRVTGAGAAPSHVLGTIHVSDPRAAPSATMREALEQADVLALELAEVAALTSPKVLETLRLRGLALLLAKAEERAERLFAPDEIAAIERALALLGVPAVAARTFKPALLAMILSQPRCAFEPAEAGPVLDARLADAAKREGVPVVGLETVLEQAGALAGFAPEVQRDLVLAALKLLPHAEDLYETAIARYARGEIGALLVLARRGGPVRGLDVALPPAFAEHLVDERNRRMLERALPLLKQGNALVAVGAAHLPGERGLLALLVQAGFAVEPIAETPDRAETATRKLRQ